MKKISFLALLSFLLAVNFTQAAKRYETNERSSFGFLSTGIGITPRGAKKLKTPWLRPHPGPAVWDAIEPTRGNFDWSDLDRVVAAAQKKNLHLLITIWPYAAWDQELCHKSLKSATGFEGELPEKRGAPCDDEAFKNFLTKLVERYDGDKKDDMPRLRYGVRHFEILNEPEMNSKNSPEMVFFQGSERDYLKILKTSYGVIKRANPEAKVLPGGMAGIGGFMTKFWKKVFKMGGGKYFDIGNIHFINAQARDFNASEYKNLLRRYKIKKPFWVTEVQVQSGGAPMTQGEEPRTEEEQAAMIVRGYVQAFAAGVKKAFYTIYKAQAGASESLNNGALIDTDSRKKPAYYAMVTMVSKIDYFSSVEKIAEGQYKFSKGEGRVYVLWQEDGVSGIPLELQNRIVNVTDMAGNVSTKYGYEINLTSNPVFVE